MRTSQRFLRPIPSRSEPAIVGAAERARLARLQDVSLTAMLLVQCGVMFVAAPLTALGYVAARYTIDALVLAFVALVILISRGRTAALVAALGAGSAMAGAAAHLFDPSAPTVLITHIGAVIGVAVCGYIIARALFAPGVVTLHRLLGAIVLYLNTALTFTIIFRLVRDFAPNAFSGIDPDASEMQAVPALIYFSLVNLTSTGFGDIVPLHPVARSLANIEAIFGQLYPATLVAALLTQHLEARRTPHAVPPPGDA